MDYKPLGVYYPFLYEARNGHEVFRGRAAQVARHTGHNSAWVQNRAKVGKASSDGWTVKRVGGVAAKRHVPKIMVAEKRGDDPIIGTAEEIAELLALTGAWVRKLRRTGLKTREGWSVRFATDAEIKEVME